MSLKKYGYGSVSNFPLPKGCEQCTRGAKMVLLVTGRCDTGCFYCPVSNEKRGKDIMYANERRIYSLEEALEEAEAMDALGTGITGGDPLTVMDRTLDAVCMLKGRFGPDHHIHLYTSSIDLDKARKLDVAGLDEIRFHPPSEEWANFDTSDIKRIISETGLDVGVEVPAIPGTEKELEALIISVTDVGVRFVNINEMEFSESNWDMMGDRGYHPKDELSSSILGSEDLARNMMKKHKKLPIHYCSSAFKDGVQLRNRLIRRADNTAKEYDVVTKDGTVLKGVIYADDLNSAEEMLSVRFSVPAGLMSSDAERGRIEIAPWILERIYGDLTYACYIVEEYPTHDRMEVERTPLRKRK